MIITNATGARTAIEAVKQVGLPQERVFEFADPHDHNTKSGLPSWTSIWASESEAQGWTWRTFSSMQEAQTTTAAINYSSGYVYCYCHNNPLY